MSSCPGRTFASLRRLEMGNFLPAIREQLQQAYAEADARPADPEAVGALAEQQGRLDDAVRHFEAAVENRPNDRAAH